MRRLAGLAILFAASVGVAIADAPSKRAENFESCRALKPFSFDVADGYFVSKNVPLDGGTNAIRLNAHFTRLGKAKTKWVPLMALWIENANTRAQAEIVAEDSQHLLEVIIAIINLKDQSRIETVNLYNTFDLTTAVPMLASWTPNGAVTFNVGGETRTVNLQGPILQAELAGSTGAGIFDPLETGVLTDLSTPCPEAVTTSNPKNASALFDSGQEYARQGKYERAIQEYNQAIILKPDFASAYISRDVAFSELAQYLPALQDETKAIALKPYSAAAYNNRCLVRALWGQELDIALDDCGKALTVGTPSNGVYSSRALVFFRKGDFAAAIKDCDTAIASDPKDADARFIRGLAKLRSSDSESGLADIAKAKALDPRISEYYAKYGFAPEGNASNPRP